jgi:exosome complex component RRP45
VSASLVRPFADRPTEGQLSVSVDFSPMAAPSLAVGRPPAEATEIALTIERLLKDGRALDTEALCVLAGEAAWSLRCDLQVLDHGGNLMDACVLAAVLALLHVRLPHAETEGRRVRVVPAAERVPSALALYHTPLTLSFALVGTAMLLDPSEREEAVAEGRVSVGVNGHGEVCGLVKLGGQGLSRDALREAVAVATRQADQICAWARAQVAEAEEAERAKLEAQISVAASRLALRAT